MSLLDEINWQRRVQQLHSALRKFALHVLPEQASPYVEDGHRSQLPETSSSQFALEVMSILGAEWSALLLESTEESQVVLRCPASARDAPAIHSEHFAHVFALVARSESSVGNRN